MGSASVGKRFASLQEVIDWLEEVPRVSHQVDEESDDGSKWTMQTSKARITVERPEPGGQFVITNYESLDERVHPPRGDFGKNQFESSHRSMGGGNVGESDLDILAPPGHGMFASEREGMFQPPSSYSNASMVRPPGARFDPVFPFNPLGEPDNDELMPPGQSDPLRNPFPTRTGQPGSKPGTDGKGKNAPFGGPFPGSHQPPFM